MSLPDGVPINKPYFSNFILPDDDQRAIVPGWGVVLFVLTYIVMIGHQAEHVAQVYQKWAQKAQCPFECRGLMGNIFDLEWVHWAYNTSTFLVLAVAWLGMRMWRRQARVGHEWSWWSLTLGIFVVQGYHIIEHSAKIGQWLINGHQSPTPGIIGAALPPPTPTSFSLIELHFAINTVVFIMVTIGFIGYRIWKLVPASLHLEKSRAGQTALFVLIAVIFTVLAFLGTRSLLHQGHHPTPVKTVNTS